MIINEDKDASYGDMEKNERCKIKLKEK